MAEQIFNFTEAGWDPTSPYIFSFTVGEAEEECYAQWLDIPDLWHESPNQQWQECSEPFTYLRQIWTDDTYVYAATTDGLNIIELESEQAYAHVTYEGGFKSVWADDTRVYLATSLSGIKYIDKTCISGSVDSPYELIVCLTDYLNYPDILSNKTRYIHGNAGHMAISTASGVNYRGPNLYYNKAEGVTDLARKVFITSSGRIYYLTWDGTKWTINIKYANNQDWTEPDETYETNTFIIGSVDILDIFVTEGTSDTGVANTIFIATTSGVYVIDEELSDSNIYYTA